MQEPRQIINHVEEYVKGDLEFCKIINDDNSTLIWKGCDSISSHKHVCIEKVTYSTCGDCVCINFSYKDKENKVLTCVPCYENRLLHGISDYYGKDIGKLIKEINEKFYGEITHVCVIDPYLKCK